MKYIGCDFHPGFQVITMLDKETGEMGRAPAAAYRGSAGFLRRIAGTGVGGDRGQREHALV
jgi:hypothetical protein